MLVGITGPSGAGKSLLVNAFAARDFVVLDADKIAREIVMPGQPALMRLAAEFGDDIINPDGTLDRHLLASRAFSSPESTERLNAITLGSICQRMLEMAEKCGADGQSCLFDAPLLYEGGLEKVCDCVVAITAPVELRIKRLALRDGLDEGELAKRIARQHEDSYYTDRADYVMINDKSEAEAIQTAQEIADRVVFQYLMKG